jgi:hypothetical protein
MKKSKGAKFDAGRAVWANPVSFDEQHFGHREGPAKSLFLTACGKRFSVARTPSLVTDEKCAKCKAVAEAVRR